MVCSVYITLLLAATQLGAGSSAGNQELSTSNQHGALEVMLNKFRMSHYGLLAV